LLKWLALIVLGGYAALAATLYFAQRKLMYFPDSVRHAPAVSGLSQFEEVSFNASDGVRLLAWYAPPRDESKPLIIYFQGNGGGLDLRAHRFGRLAAAGFGILALNYRGYGGSSGAPSEEGILRDADAAYVFAAARFPVERIVLWGESLGTGVAVALAATRPVARVLLESPYTSTADIAAATYWYVPVRLLMRDQFRSVARIGNVTAPVMILHGARDTVVPIGYGERLFELVRAPKRFVRLPEAGHNDHDDFGGLDAVMPFLADGTL
jgi:fermentation-respiration switch protein FrsA (DUF1100 family)